MTPAATSNAARPRMRRLVVDARRRAAAVSVARPAPPGRRPSPVDRPARDAPADLLLIVLSYTRGRGSSRAEDAMNGTREVTSHHAGGAMGQRQGNGAADATAPMAILLCTSGQIGRAHV